MTQLTSWVTENISYVILALTALLMLALIIFININMRLAKLNRRYQQMMKGIDSGNLEAALLKHLDAVKQAGDKAASLETECRRLDARLQSCVQKMGVVRFNAFEGTGSDLSFAIALLDAHNNGVVLSSIFGRNESRIYAKPVENGQSSYFLTDEEKQALADAKEKFSKR
jgi:hypothetical protein